MLKKPKKSSLLSKYAALYEKNPKSRVFAPLAESYRKLGMLPEALQILKEGIKRHPSYVMGYSVLGHCYFDQQNYELAYNTVRPFVASNLENISLQKLFAQICINLGHLEEALQTFKYLLLINPKDEFVSDQVKLLEDDLLVNEKAEDEGPFPENESFGEDEDEWVQVNFSANAAATNNEEVPDEGDEWSMESPEKEKLDVFKKDVASEGFKVEEHSLDDDYYFEEYDNDAEDGDPQRDFGEESSHDESIKDPIITHTLVDLYIRQGHKEKAKEILESILELHPHDKASSRKLKELQEFQEGEKGLTQDFEEDTNDLDLANLVEEKVKTANERSKKMLENKLNIFLQKIRKQSKLRLTEL